MIAVAVSAVGIAVIPMMERRRYHLEQAANHSARAEEWAARSERNLNPDQEVESLRREIEANPAWADMLRDDIENLQKNREGLAERWEETVAAQRANAEYYRGLVRRDLRAARYPWLPVAPDPPMPK